jgi:hypothetical protein
MHVTRLDRHRGTARPYRVNEIDPTELGSLALARLVREVQSDASLSATAYNRTYHRHNR